MAGPSLTDLETETPVLPGRPSVWFGAGCHIHPPGCQSTEGHLDLHAQVFYTLHAVHHGIGCFVSGESAIG